MAPGLTHYVTYLEYYSVVQCTLRLLPPFLPREALVHSLTRVQLFLSKRVRTTRTAKCIRMNNMIFGWKHLPHSLPQYYSTCCTIANSNPGSCSCSARFRQQQSGDHPAAMPVASGMLLLLLLLRVTCAGASSDGSYSCAKGAGQAGGDLIQKEGLTLAAAQGWCLANASCAAFTFASNATCAAEAGSSRPIGSVYFKRGISR